MGNLLNFLNKFLAGAIQEVKQSGPNKRINSIEVFLSAVIIKMSSCLLIEISNKFLRMHLFELFSELLKNEMFTRYLIEIIYTGTSSDKVLIEISSVDEVNENLYQAKAPIVEYFKEVASIKVKAGKDGSIPEFAKMLTQQFSGLVTLYLESLYELCSKNPDVTELLDHNTHLCDLVIAILDSLYESADQNEYISIFSSAM